MGKLTVLALLVFSLVANASQLDLAVVQFPEVKTAGELDAALANVNLAGITNSDRTMTTESYLKGGYVIFAQSFPLSEHFASTTRISNSRADVRGPRSRPASPGSSAFAKCLEKPPRPSGARPRLRKPIFAV